MHKYLFVILIATSSFMNGQEETSAKGLKYQSVSFNLPPFSVYGGNGTGGIQLGADLTLSYKKHLFTFMVSAGSEFTILGSSDSFGQLNLMYGREFALSRTVFFEIHGGAGYFNFKSVDVDPVAFGQETAQTVGFPIMTKLRIHTGPRFSVGLLTGLNYNSAATVWNVGFVLQWNKRKWQ